ncbi:MAG TPA: phosphate-starvation-inducible PsiE family protein [Vicinamibacterales bacterium]
MIDGAAKELPRHWSAIRQHWRILTFYQRFETSLAYLLTFVIGTVIVVALGRLMVSVVDTLLLESQNPLEHSVFQQVFGEIMTLLIAMEFNHTLRYEISRDRGVIQAQVVILIALLALARKVIILDLQELTPAVVISLGILTFSLGATYWLIREANRRASGGAVQESRES